MQPNQPIIPVSEPSPGWLVPLTERAPAGRPGTTWYASLHRGSSDAEDVAYTALSWLLGVLLCDRQVWEPHPDTFSDAVLLVPSTDALAMTVADTATALYFLTGAFTQDQAEAFIGVPLDQLLLPITVPADVIAPAQEVASARGWVPLGGRVWVWQQVADSYPTGQAEPRQGMLRAGTQADAIERLRQGVPDAGAIEWISRREYRFPMGLRAAREEKAVG